MKFIKSCISKISITVWFCFCAGLSFGFAVLALPTPWSKGLIYSEDEMVRAHEFVREHDGRYSQSIELGFVPVHIESTVSTISYYGNTISVEMFRQMLAAKLLHNQVVYSGGSELVVVADPQPGLDTTAYRTRIEIPNMSPLLVTRSHVVTKQGDTPGTIEITWDVCVGWIWIVDMVLFGGGSFMALTVITMVVVGLRDFAHAFLRKIKPQHL